MLDQYLQGGATYDDWMGSMQPQQTSRDQYGGMLDQAIGLYGAMGGGAVRDYAQPDDLLGILKLLNANQGDAYSQQRQAANDQFSQNLDTTKLGLAQNEDVRQQGEYAAQHGDPSNDLFLLGQMGFPEQSMAEMFSTGNPEQFAKDMDTIAPLLGLTDDTGAVNWRTPANQARVASWHQALLDRQQGQAEAGPAREPSGRGHGALTSEERAKEAYMRFTDPQRRSFAVVPGGGMFTGANPAAAEEAVASYQDVVARENAKGEAAKARVEAGKVRTPRRAWATSAAAGSAAPPRCGSRRKYAKAHPGRARAEDGHAVSLAAQGLPKAVAPTKRTNLQATSLLQGRLKTIQRYGTPSQLATAKRTAGGGSPSIGARLLEGVGYVLGAPLRATVATGDELAEMLGGKTDDRSWWENVNDPSYGFGRVVEKLAPDGNKWVKRVAGLAGDVLFDPLTYVTFGASAALKEAGRSAGLARLAQEAADVAEVAGKVDEVAKWRGLAAKAENLRGPQAGQRRAGRAGRPGRPGGRRLPLRRRLPHTAGQALGHAGGQRGGRGLRPRARGHGPSGGAERAGHQGRWGLVRQHDDGQGGGRVGRPDPLPHRSAGARRGEQRQGPRQLRGARAQPGHGQAQARVAEAHPRHRPDGRPAGGTDRGGRGGERRRSHLHPAHGGPDDGAPAAGLGRSHERHPRLRGGGRGLRAVAPAGDPRRHRGRPTLRPPPGVGRVQAGGAQGHPARPGQARPASVAAEAGVHGGRQDR